MQSVTYYFLDGTVGHQAPPTIHSIDIGATRDHLQKVSSTLFCDRILYRQGRLGLRINRDLCSGTLISFQAS